MKYVPPLGMPGESSYENFNPQAGVDGSIVSAEAIEHPQREIVNAIKALGLAPSGTDLSQLASILTGFNSHLNSLDQGLTNLLKPATASRLGGIMVGSGLKVTAAGLLSLKVLEGSGLVMDNDGQLYFDPSQMPTDKFEELLKSIRVPVWLSKNTTWYVNGATGSDNNDGSATNKAFKTIQHALNYVSENFNLGAYTATIVVSPDVIYSEDIILPKCSSSTGYMVLRGGGPGQTILAGSINGITSAGTFYLNNFDIVFDGRVSSSSSLYTALRVPAGVRIIATSVNVDVKDVTSSFSRECTNIAGALDIRNNCSFRGTALYSLYTNSGEITIGGDLYINGTFTSSTARAVNLGRISTSVNTNGGVNPIITGNATGRRYTATNNSIINTNGGGADYFPGSTAGSTSSGAQYS